MVLLQIRQEFSAILSCDGWVQAERLRVKSAVFRLSAPVTSISAASPSEIQRLTLCGIQFRYKTDPSRSQQMEKNSPMTQFFNNEHPDDNGVNGFRTLRKKIASFNEVYNTMVKSPEESVRG
jgi:hypothetical protein